MVQTQSAVSLDVSNPRPVVWTRIELDDVKIVVDGSTELRETFLIQIDNGETIFTFPHTLLEVILRFNEEELSNMFIEFRSERHGKKRD